LLQETQEITRRARAIIWMLFKSLHDGLAHLDGDRGTVGNLIDGEGLSCHVLGGPLPGRIGRKGQLAREHFVSHATERINVTASIQLHTRELFGAHVRGGSKDHPLLGELGLLFCAG
jgi:hypothetical protein